jgi:hypothetical protein
LAASFILAGRRHYAEQLMSLFRRHLGNLIAVKTLRSQRFFLKPA